MPPFLNKSHGTEMVQGTGPSIGAIVAVFDIAGNSHSKTILISHCRVLSALECPSNGGHKLAIFVAKCDV